MAVSDDQLSEWIEGLTTRVEARLRQTLATPHQFVEEASRYLVEAGGKMFRPALVMAAGGLGLEAGGVDEDSLVSAAVAVELTHVASLYHDDVIDEAELRRGGLSAHQKWSNSVAIMIGDYLLAEASVLGASLGVDFVRYQGHTISRLVQGEIAEMVGPEAGVDRISHHLEVIRGKTAALINAAARYGGWFGGLEPDQVEALTEYGENLGMAFQLADDLLDIVSEESGKGPGTDLREGVPTLTTLLIQTHHRDEDARLLELLAGPVPDEDLPEALALVRAHPAVEEARAEVRQWSETARSHLVGFPDSASLRLLHQVCDQAVLRSS
ncbi:MAG: polyprenyl synthetase family protein [Propionibacteriaceae bacterium]|nr:polyprenyl synthetase family protein [Propionibacteriaceae bacterium]